VTDQEVLEMPTRPRDEGYERARQRAELIQSFYIHLLVYLVVNAGLFIINFATTSGDGPWWFIWPIIGWGIGLMVHLVVTISPVFAPEWVDRRAERMVSRR
jgi:hypothetical protein